MPDNNLKPWEKFKQEPSSDGAKPWEKFSDVKKKVQSEPTTIDSEGLAKPSSKSGEQERLDKSVESITSKFTKPIAEVKKEVADWDSGKERAINIISDLQKQQKGLPTYLDPNGGMPSESTSVKQINPLLKDLAERKSATMENGRKAFKVNFIEENPALQEKLSSDKPEEVEQANKEIYQAWLKEPDILAGTEKTKENRSWYEVTYDAFKEGMDERDFNLSMARELAEAPTSEAKKLLELEYKRAIEQSQDIQRPQEDLMSNEGISKMVGTQAIPIATTVGLSLLPIPIVNKAASMLYAGFDAAATSYGAAFRGSYIQARSQGIGEEESYDIAKKEAKVNAATGFAEGIAGATTSGIATKYGSKFAGRFGSKSLKPIVDAAATGTLDMGLDAAAAATGQMINNWSAKTSGLETDLFEGVADEMLGEIIFSAGSKGLTQAYNASNSVAEFKKYVNSLPAKDQQEVFNSVVDAKENIERKILNDQTNSYLNLKGQEALSNDNQSLAEQIKSNPAKALKDDILRLTKIESQLKNETAKKETTQNIKALLLMLENVEQRVIIKEDGSENIIGAEELSERIDDLDFVAKVANGEINVDINNNVEVAEKLNDAITKFKEDAIKDEPGVSSDKPEGKTSVKKESKQGDGGVEAEASGDVQASKEKVSPEKKRNFAIESIVTGQIQPRKEGATQGREDFGMPTKEVNAAIQNIKDVSDGKKTKYSKPAENLIAKLEEYYDQDDIPIIEGTGGTTIRARGIPIADVEKSIENAKKGIEQKTIIDDSDLEQDTKDWLNEDDDWEGIGALDHANISSKIIEWTGDKMPEPSIKKAIKTLRGDIESGINKKDAINNSLDEMKSTDWYKDLSDAKQKEFDYDFRKSLGDDMKSSKKVEIPVDERVFIRQDERTILKDKIKNLSEGAKIGAKEKESSLVAVKKDLVNYVDQSLKEFPITKAKQREINNMIATANSNTIERTMERIDKIVEVNEEADRKKTIRDIKDFIGSKKSILKKVGKKWKGKVPIEVQEFIKNFDTDKLNTMSRSEVKETQNILNNILSEGAAETKSIERAVRAQKRRVEAEVFQEFYEGSTETLNDKQSIEDALDGGEKVAIIDNQLISSKTAFKELLKDNPSVNLENVTTFDKKTKQIQELNKRSEETDFFNKWLNPTTRKANLTVNLLPLIKGSKVMRQKVEGIISDVNDAYFNMNEDRVSKIKSYKEKVENIFFNAIPSGISKDAIKFIGGKSNYATRRLSKHADVIPHKEMIHPPTNDMMVNWYSLAQTKLGLEGLNRSGVDVEAVNEYINRPENADLKAYSDYLLNDFYPSLKGEYEPTYTHITNTKFPDDLVYYPTYSEKTDLAETIDTEGIMDKDFNVNYMKPVSGNLEQRVKHNNMLNLTNGAHEVAIDYVNKMERAKHFISVGESVNEIFSKNNIPGIINKIGVQNFNSLIDHLSIIITGQIPSRRKQSTADNYFFKGLMGLRTFGALAFKMASIPKQLTSFTHYSTAPGVTMEEWIGGFAPVTKQENEVYRRINKSNYVKERFQGRSIDIEANRLLDSSKRSKINSLISDMTRLGMMPISIGDIGGVLMGGRPLALAVYRQGKMEGLTHEEAYAKAYKTFVDESESAQQSTRESETSHLQRDNIGRLFTAFTTSQTQTTNKMVGAAKNLLSKSDLNSDQIRENLYNLIYYTGANVGFAMVANGFIKELFNADFEDEDSLDAVKKGAYDTSVDNIQSILSGFGEHGIIANFIINSFRGDDWKNDIPIVQGINNIANGSAALFQFTTTNKKWEDMTPSEQKKIFATVSAESLYKQYDDFKKYFNEDKTLFDAIMGYKNEKERSNFKPKDDEIYKSIFGKPYYYDDLSALAKKKYDMEHTPSYIERQSKMDKRKKEMDERKKELLK